ncbi:MAG: asparaginase [Ruminococcaceae bacterium]|nr:asparaginase [Oscillospiraceae bacterium]
MKILLLTTGGTIASIIDDGVVDVKPQGRLLVLRKYREIDTDTEFEVVSPINILSENVTFDNYKALINAMLQIDFDLYDGIIITHGSDTLAYTSAMIGLLFSNINKPIAIVAADRSLQDEKSNGLDNFIAGVKIIKAGKNGVYVPYKNADGVTYIHHATNLLESGILSDDFHSVGGACAVFENGVISDLECSVEKQKGIKIEDADLSFSKNIVQIFPYPELDYSKIDISKADAVIHRTYHAGSVCANKNGEKSVTALIYRCKEKNIPLYICGLKSGKANYYSLNSVLFKGVKPLYDMSPACAYIKLLLEG